MDSYRWLDGYLLSMKGARREFKEEWGWDRYLVGGRMFAALCGHPDLGRIVTLKCGPGSAEASRRSFPEDVFPGYYMNKSCWNSVRLDGGLPEETLKEMCCRSYAIVLGELPKKLRAVAETG